MFTTMNCDFLETKYFYSLQHSGQGEEQCDTLSWLRYTSEESCLNQNTTSTGAQEQSSPKYQCHRRYCPKPNIRGVQEHEEPTLTEVEEPTLIEVLEKYVLPTRSNRGIPPKRYTQKKSPKVLKEAPSNVEQALKSEKWKNAMDVDMDALMRNGTRDKCILLQGKKPVGCRWIFTIKYKLDGTVERYKARLVAKGYTQTYEIDYSETFSPVAKIDTIRVLFSIAANQGWPFHQFDVKNAFLHGELKEEVYMEAPPGFSQHFKHGEVWEFICQKKYILDLLAETEMIDCKPADTPMITNQKLFMKTKAKVANRDRYQRMIGKLIYLSHTRPDIAYAVGVVSQFMYQPQAGDKGNRRSTFGYFSLVGGNLVTWKSKKQKVVSLSSAEAEFRGIAKGLAEALWIRKLVSEIGFPPKESIRIMSDNKAAIQISENHVQHDKTKQVEVDRHFIKEKLEAGIIKLPFVKSKNQLADILTKAVGIVILHKCLNKLNFGDPTIQLEGLERIRFERSANIIIFPV
nr:putative ribonuclease H-like domain-containing protein [Tanacetum cinerariifolium]